MVFRDYFSQVKIYAPMHLILLGCEFVNCDRHMLYEQVFKGRKMPGRMGGKQRTVKNVWVYKIDPARNFIWVRGQVCFSHKIYFSE